jgi:hypothetical protein
MLHRFWIEFEDAPRLCWWPIGFGVTAANAEEAMAVVADWCQEAGVAVPVRPVMQVDVDVSDLRARKGLGSHIMVPCNQGLWFPRVNL